MISTNLGFHRLQTLSSVSLCSDDPKERTCVWCGGRRWQIIGRIRQNPPHHREYLQGLNKIV